MKNWWDEHADTGEFEYYIGGSDARTKQLSREYVKKRKFKSLLDVGFGLATEYDAYKTEYPELQYWGVDSSKALVEKAKSRGVQNVFFGNSSNCYFLEPKSFDVVFCRHVLEHLKDYVPTLNEMIRLAKKEVLIVFFLRPCAIENDDIRYDAVNNLYHNQYSSGKLHEIISANKQVNNIWWQEATNLGNEGILHIELKD